MRWPAARRATATSATSPARSADGSPIAVARSTMALARVAQPTPSVVLELLAAPLGLRRRPLGVVAGEVGVGRDEQALGDVELTLRALGLEDRLLGHLAGLGEEVRLEQGAGVVEAQRTGQRSLVRAAGVQPRRSLEGVEGRRQVAFQRGDVGEVLLGDGAQQGLLQLGALGDRQLEVLARLVEPAEVGEQRADVGVHARLAEEVTGGAEQFDRRRVLDHRRVEVAALVQHDAPLRPQPAAAGAGHRRLGDVEDLQRRHQLALVGDDEREGDGDLAGEVVVGQVDGAHPGPFELDPGLVEVAELAPGHADRPPGEHLLARRRAVGEQRRRPRDRPEGIALHAEHDGFGAVVVAAGHRDERNEPRRSSTCWAS